MASSLAMNQAPQPTRRTRRDDLGGHGAFTYMVMYSVRAQSSRYIGLSQSSDTMPHHTTKCSFSPSPSSYLAPIYSSYRSSYSILSLSYYDIVIHYSILRHHEFPRDDILIVRRAANRQHTAIHGRSWARETRGRRCWQTGQRGCGESSEVTAGVRDGARQTKGHKYNSMYNVWTLLECLMKSCLISNNASKCSFASKSSV